MSRSKIRLNQFLKNFFIVNLILAKILPLSAGADIQYEEEKPKLDVILKTGTSILLKKYFLPGQQMHYQTGFV